MCWEDSVLFIAVHLWFGGQANGRLCQITFCVRSPEKFSSACHTEESPEESEHTLENLKWWQPRARANLNSDFQVALLSLAPACNPAHWPRLGAPQSIQLSLWVEVVAWVEMRSKSWEPSTDVHQVKSAFTQWSLGTSGPSFEDPHTQKSLPSLLTLLSVCPSVFCLYFLLKDFKIK